MTSRSAGAFTLLPPHMLLCSASCPAGGIKGRWRKVKQTQASKVLCWCWVTAEFHVSVRTALCGHLSASPSDFYTLFIFDPKLKMTPHPSWSPSWLVLSIQAAWKHSSWSTAGEICVRVVPPFIFLLVLFSSFPWFLFLLSTNATEMQHSSWFDIGTE